MTNLDILTRLSEAGLLREEESVTIAHHGEAESLSLTMEHPVAFVGTVEDMDILFQRLALAYSGNSPVCLLYGDGTVRKCAVAEGGSQLWKEGVLFWFDARKAAPRPVTPYTLDQLLATMDTLLSPHGCPWDKAQTHESLKTYFLQETYEVIDAIDKKDWKNLCEELGDVLYQVVFHARLAEKEGHFTMQDVVDGIDAKMRRRHLFLFDKNWDLGVTSAPDTWEKRKRLEKNRKYLLSGVSKALPSLLLACIIQKKVGSSGLGDILPETGGDSLRKLCVPVHSAETIQEKEKEAGLLLFALGRVLGGESIEPELALRRFTLHFMQRFHAFEQAREAEGHPLTDSSPAEVLEAWQRFIDHPGEP